MDARTATDHQKLRETHELQLLKEAQQAPAKGRGRPTVQQPVSSFSTSATGPPMSQQPSQYMAVNNFTEVTQSQFPVALKGVPLLASYNHFWACSNVFPS